MLPATIEESDILIQEPTEDDDGEAKLALLFQVHNNDDLASRVYLV